MAGEKEKEGKNGSVEFITDGMRLFKTRYCGKGGGLVLCCGADQF